MATHAGADYFGDSVRLWNSQYRLSYTHVAATTLLAFEYSLTLSREIKYIWKKPLNNASLLFLLIRYTSMYYAGFGLIQAISGGAHNVTAVTRMCSVVGRLVDGCTVINHALLALFAAIRTYAIWDQHKGVFVFVFGLGMVFPGGFIYYMAMRAYLPAPSPAPGCVSYTYETLPTGYRAKIGSEQFFYIIGVCIKMAFETAVITLTWTKTVPTMRSLIRANIGIARMMSYIIFRDGTMHFIAMLLMHVVGMVYFATQQSSDDFAPRSTRAIQISELGILTPLEEAIIPVLLSRFILDLKKSYLSEQEGSLREGSSRNMCSEELGSYKGRLVTEDSHIESSLVSTTEY